MQDKKTWLIKMVSQQIFKANHNRYLRQFQTFRLVNTHANRWKSIMLKFAIKLKKPHSRLILAQKLKKKKIMWRKFYTIFSLYAAAAWFKKIYFGPHLPQNFKTKLRLSATITSCVKSKKFHTSFFNKTWKTSFWAHFESFLKNSDW